MNKNWAYLPLILIPVIDQIAKSNSIFLLNQNYMMGFFSSVPLFYKSVLMISFFLILLAGYIFVLLLLNPEVPLLRISASSYLAGMFSNCIDKMIFLGVRDHLTFNKIIYFNFADVFQWISLPFVIFSLYYYSNELWSEKCLRKSLLVGVKSQLQISFNLVIIVFINILFIGFFCISFLNYINVSAEAYTQFLKLYSIFSIAIVLSSSLFIFIYSQRIVGPFVSLISFIKSKKYKEKQTFKIRKGDPLTELEVIADIITQENL